MGVRLNSLFPQMLNPFYYNPGFTSPWVAGGKDTNDIIPRKEYIGLTSAIIEVMDIHIKSQFLENTKKNNENKIITNVSPANAYIDFINTNQSIIQEEYVILSKKENNVYFDEKIKKTYKNRYFIQSKNIQGK